ILPFVQFRIAGGGNRQRAEYFARRAAQLPARRCLSLFASEFGARGFVAGGAGFTALCHALEVGCRPGTGAVAIPGWEESPAADSEDSRGRFAGVGVSGGF